MQNAVQNPHTFCKKINSNYWKSYFSIEQGCTSIFHYKFETNKEFLESLLENVNVIILPFLQLEQNCWLQVIPHHLLDGPKKKTLLSWHFTVITQQTDDYYDPDAGLVVRGIDLLRPTMTEGKLKFAFETWSWIVSTKLHAEWNNFYVTWTLREFNYRDPNFNLWASEFGHILVNFTLHKVEKFTYISKFRATKCVEMANFEAAPEALLRNFDFT